MTDSKLRISGRLARLFQASQITPLLALVCFLLGVFAVLVTPREEEPQINVTMANVLIPFPGASVKDVEQMVSGPAEQVLSQITGVEHVMSVSQPGMSVVTVQYKVGVPRTEALVRLYDTVNSHADWLPKGLGVMQPLIKPKGIDDVPILSLTLHGKDADLSAFELEGIAQNIEMDLKRVKGTREVTTMGGPSRAIQIDIDPARMQAAGITVPELRMALQGAHLGAPVGDLLVGQQAIAIESGPFFSSAKDVASLVVGVRAGTPIHVHDIAQVRDGGAQANTAVWHGVAGAKPNERTAVTIAVTKKPGENAIEVADAVLAQVATLKQSKIPANVDVTTTRNYGETANDKAQKLIQKLLFATASVVALVFIALGRREAAIVGTAVILTLTVTLFASWAWGFTLNRVSLFALIFSIGILVDDAIVVVENIHRHQALFPHKTLTQIIPGAVDEVGAPTILATFTVIAALLPMAFVTGLMGPYMSPIPINASMGMLLSLAVAFVVTPWLARIWMKTAHTHDPADNSAFKKWLKRFFHGVFSPFLNAQSGQRNRWSLGAAVLGAIVLSVALPVAGLVALKMLPFDNKSEFQVVVDMPSGTRVEETEKVLRALGAHLATVPEVINYQAYAGLSAPINFNGLVRQYYLRSGGHVGDIQVNLQDKHLRKAQSHIIATRERPALQAIGKQFNANVKVIEVPPGPPVLAPIVAEVYGPTDEGRHQVAKSVRAMFNAQSGVVDVDDSTISAAPRQVLLINRQKAAQMGVSHQAIVSTLRAGLAGESTVYAHDQNKYAGAIVIRLPKSEQDSLEKLLSLGVRNSQREIVPIRQLVTVSDTQREQPIYHKDLLPVTYVVGDMAGKVDSPLYGMFGMRSGLGQIQAPNGQAVDEYFIQQPKDPYQHYAVKWDGEWQMTYETFRDMGAAYALGLVLIYLLVVAQFGSYLVPLIIMAPIPLTIIGVMPGHALLGAPYTATSMIGMIALAGIIVRNSILLVDFIRLQVSQGVALKDAVVASAITRAQPIVLTGLAAMMGAFFILDDPIFNGLAISLIFGIFVSTALTLLVIPLLYFMAFKNKPASVISGEHA
ncbi:multidrug transporter AcrB [Limnohabitans sp. MORI2]|uniref:efflux RND transporter permease subunit n=1 Tax=Limnohabitans sp. MORI2 TaxID=1751150 RepID=UPI002377581E|nr:efflux RND transporter permease subunit [Limnohabitans sp. MORI2]BDU57635.1 multidrug transporter AcrB [Limnohabitans sp. MORI2]